MAATDKSKRTEELWNSLLVSYRTHPGNHSEASRACSLSREACRTAYEKGWPEHAFAVSSIRTILSREQNERSRQQLDAKLRVLDGEGAAEEAERQERIEARTQEHEAMGRMRRNALAFAGIGSNALIAANKAALALRGRAEALTPSAQDAEEARLIMRDASLLALRSGVFIRNTMEMQRILTGQPIAVIGVKTDGLNADDVVDALSALAQSLVNAENDGIEGKAGSPALDAPVDAAWEELTDEDGAGEATPGGTGSGKPLVARELVGQLGKRACEDDSDGEAPGEPSNAELGL